MSFSATPPATKRATIAEDRFNPYSATKITTDADSTVATAKQDLDGAPVLVRAFAIALVTSGFVYRGVFGGNWLVPILIPSYIIWFRWARVASGEGGVHSPFFWACSSVWHVLLYQGGKWNVPNFAPAFFLFYSKVHYVFAAVISLTFVLHLALRQPQRDD